MNYSEYEEEKKKTHQKVKIHELINFDKKSQNIKVSVIIPVYNVEEYLHECIESVISQSLKEIEIICVNDGSTDNSLQILKEYAIEDPRIKIINKDNAGYGHTMNLGMDYASGEYIGIVESDDYIEEGMYETLYKTAHEHDLDFVKSNFYRFQKGDTYFQKYYNNIARKEENYNKIINPQEYQQCFTFVMNTWSGIYKREFIQKNNIRHSQTPGASFQDNGFWFKTNVCATRTMYIKDAFYMNRRDNPNSSVQNPKKILCMNEEYELIYKFLEEKNIKEKYMDVYNFKRYENYRFTLQRIAPEYKKNYLQVVSDEFNQSNEKGEFYSKYFTPSQQNNVNWIMRDPDEFYYQHYMKKIKVSVILPVYNAEDNLRECLDSLSNQNMQEYEIICINDGSKDGSLEILKEYRAKNNKIIIINQEHHGVAYARNKAIQDAKGEYLYFIDADDKLGYNTLKLAYNHATRQNAEICIFETYQIDDLTSTTEINTKTLNKNNLPRRGVFNRYHIKSNIFKDISCNTWDKLFKKSFIKNNHLRFQDIRTNNTMYFVYTALLKADRITILYDTLYYHRINVANSLTNTRELSYDNFIKALQHLKNELKAMKIYDEYKRDFVNYALHICLYNLELLKKPISIQLFKKLKSKYFRQLDILGHDQTYYENKTEYRKLQEIIKLSPDDKEAYYNYQINNLKNKNNKEDIQNIQITINENEQLTIDEIVQKLNWYRSQYR